MIKIYFYSGSKIGDLLVRVFTRSKFSHVAIEVDSTIYESWYKTGVRKFNCPVNYSEVIEICGLNEKDMKAFLEAQVGKPYDFKAIFSFLFSHNWEELKAWFCSELVAMALKVGGFRNIPNNISKISPGDLYKIVKND